MFFYPGSIYSYVSVSFALGLELIYDILDALIHVFTSVGESVVVTHVYRACSILFIGFQTWVDLVILYMANFV